MAVMQLCLSWRCDPADFTTALDKIADSTGEATSKATDSTKGVAATAAEYITSGEIVSSSQRDVSYNRASVCLL